MDYEHGEVVIDDTYQKAYVYDADRDMLVFSAAETIKAFYPHLSATHED